MTAIGPILMFAVLFATTWASDRRQPKPNRTLHDLERDEAAEHEWAAELARREREYEQGGDSWAHGGAGREQVWS